MKSDKSTLKKTIKSVAQKIRTSSVAVATKLTPKSTAKPVPKAPEPTPAPAPVKAKTTTKTVAPPPAAVRASASAPAPAKKASPAPAAKTVAPAKADPKAPAPAPIPAPIATKPQPAKVTVSAAAAVTTKISAPAPAAAKAPVSAPVQTKTPAAKAPAAVPPTTPAAPKPEPAKVVTPAPVAAKAPVSAPVKTKAPAAKAPVAVPPTTTATPKPEPAKVVTPATAPATTPAPVAAKAPVAAPVQTKAPVAKAPVAVPTTTTAAPKPEPAKVAPAVATAAVTTPTPVEAKAPIFTPVETKAPAAAAAAEQKTPAKKSALVVPAILLEGDKPSAPAPSGPGQRYALGPVPPSESSLTTNGELPEAYGTGKLLFTARDPHWIYARWDLTREQQRGYNSLSVDHHLVLRIFRDEAKGEPLAQVHVHPESAHWFVHVSAAGVKYVAELGYFSTTGSWTSIATSGATLTPPDSVSDDGSVQFTTIPLEIPFAQVIEVAKAAVLNTVPLVEVIEQLRAGGFELPAPAPAAPHTQTHKWTPEKERALAAIISMDRTRRVWMGSVEITELVRRKLVEEISSIALVQSSQPTLPGGALSSVSSPFGGVAESGKGFWFNVNAELIIYGATEPDAKVTIGDRPIKLRADGTFSYRFTLPDGKYELPAVAISADGADRRAAGLTFTRGTQYSGPVGAHRQDPQLKTPHADNVA